MKVSGTLIEKSLHHHYQGFEKNRGKYPEGSSLHSLIEAVGLAGDTLSRSITVTPLRIALRITVVIYQSVVSCDVIWQLISHYRRGRAVEICDRLLNVRRGPGESALVSLKRRYAKEVGIVEALGYVALRVGIKGRGASLYRVILLRPYPNRVGSRSVKYKLPLLQDSCNNCE